MGFLARQYHEINALEMKDHSKSEAGFLGDLWTVLS
jgi:hypothetical protein